MRISRKMAIRLLRTLPLAVLAVFALFKIAKTAAAFSGSDAAPTGAIITEGDNIG